MKKLLLIFAVAFLASCSPKVGGEIYLVSATDSSFVIGAKVVATGTQSEIASKADSLAKGYPVIIAGQWIQITYTATDVELNGLFTFKTKK